MPKYMKGFFWYPTVAAFFIILVIIVSYFLNNKESYVSILNNISLIFHYSFLGLFIIRVLPNKPNQILAKITFTVFLALIFFLLITYDNTQRNTLAFGIANFGLMLFCLWYYFQLFNTIPIFNLLREPCFWIITGIFFSMSIHVPIFFSMGYLKNKISFQNYRLLIAVSLFCYGIMHLFFIKAYICAIHPQKV
ncbi:hypothetical protein BH11BAC4_BH11BAC4_15890 [soil metagenome]